MKHASDGIIITPQFAGKPFLATLIVALAALAACKFDLIVVVWLLMPITIIGSLVLVIQEFRNRDTAFKAATLLHEEGNESAYSVGTRLIGRVLYSDKRDQCYVLQLLETGGHAVHGILPWSELSSDGRDSDISPGQLLAGIVDDVTTWKDGISVIVSLRAN